MTADPVVEDVRARGRALTARYGNDAQALLALLEEQARLRPQGVVDSIRIVSTAPQPRASA